MWRTSVSVVPTHYLIAKDLNIYQWSLWRVFKSKPALHYICYNFSSQVKGIWWRPAFNKKVFYGSRSHHDSFVLVLRVRPWYDHVDLSGVVGDDSDIVHRLLVDVQGHAFASLYAHQLDVRHRLKQQEDFQFEVSFEKQKQKVAIMFVVFLCKLHRFTMWRRINLGRRRHYATRSDLICSDKSGWTKKYMNFGCPWQSDVSLEKWKKIPRNLHPKGCANLGTRHN